VDKNEENVVDKNGRMSKNRVDKNEENRVDKMESAKNKVDKNEENRVDKKFGINCVWTE